MIFERQTELGFGLTWQPGIASDRGGKILASSASDYSLELSNTGSGDYNLFVGGNVGIGTTSPQRALHVTADILSNATINATGDICIEGGNCLSSAGSGNLGGAGAADRAAFWSDANTLSYDGNFTWDDSNKRLGIGTTNPTGRLTIKPSTGGDGIYIEEADSTNPALYAMGYNTGGALRIYNGGSIDTQISGTGDSYLNVLQGNVGIGTTNPQSKLNIIGKIMVNPTTK